MVLGGCGEAHRYELGRFTLATHNATRTLAQDLIYLLLRHALDHEQCLLGRKRQTLKRMESCLFELLAVRGGDAKFLECEHAQGPRFHAPPSCSQAADR